MPVLDHNSLEFISRSAEQTRRVGMRFGGVLQTGDVVCLAGDLGSGKTTLVQGIAAGWGSLDAVSSPSFRAGKRLPGSGTDSGYSTWMPTA